MRLTVTTLADEIFTFEVSEDMELESFRALCEIETGISAREIVVFWNGRPLHDNRRMFCIFFTLVRTGLGLDVRLGSLPMFVFIRPTLQIIVTLDSQSQVTNNTKCFQVPHRGCIACSCVTRNLYGGKKRSAKGTQIERPKASRGRGIGRGVPRVSRLRALGSIVSSPSGQKTVLVHI